MDAVTILNHVLAVLTIGFGALAMLWPRYAMEALFLASTKGRADGKAEIRAASGGGFIGTALAAMALGQFWPVAWVMLGMHYAGAGVGRLMGIVFDGAGTRKMFGFLAIEVAFAALLIALNWPASG